MLLKFIAGIVITTMGGIGFFAPDWYIRWSRASNPFAKHFPNRPSRREVRVLGFALFVGGLWYIVTYSL